MTIAMRTPMIAITVYWRFRYADAPSWMAAAISRIRALPDGIRRTRRMRMTANSTAATPPATPNRTKLGSTYLSTNLSTNTTPEIARSERVSQPSTEHAAAPPDHHAAEHHQARHEDAGDEDQGALVLLGERQRKRPGGFGWNGDQRVLLGQPLERSQGQLEVGVAVVGRQGAVLRKVRRAYHHDPSSLCAHRLQRLHDVEGSGDVARLTAEVLDRTRLRDRVGGGRRGRERN